MNTKTRSRIRIKIAIIALFLLLSGCSVGVVHLRDALYVCYNAGKTSCEYDVTTFREDGSKESLTEIRVKGGSLSDNFVDVIVGAAAYLVGLF